MIYFCFLTSYDEHFNIIDNIFRMTKSMMAERKESSDTDTDNYFVIDADTGSKDVVTKSIFIKQLKVTS